MHQSINNLVSIQNTLKIEKKGSNQTKIIAVSKTFPINEILPLINHGQVHFGENKVQEAVEKWQPIKQDFKHLQLHMIGKLQSNKVKLVVGLFDYIHSLDSLKLAEKISKEQEKRNFRPKIFVQVNIGREAQKNGIYEEEIKDFVDICKLKYDLDIEGLMCIPPIDEEPSLHFSLLKKMQERNNLSALSMGMSADFETAILFGATHVRVGTAIFGERT